MTTIAFSDRALGAVIEHYIETRRNVDKAMSLAGAVRTIRLVLNRSDVTDRDLAAAVATMAIAKRRDVAFDLDAGLQTLVLQESPAAA